MPKPDQLPEEFDLSELDKHLTEAEIEALKAGDDALIPPDNTAELAATEAARVAAEAATQQEAQVQATQQAAQDAAQADALKAQQQAAQQPIQIPDTSAAEAEVNRIGGEIEALLEKYDNADITREQFQQQQAALVKQQAVAQAQIEAAAQVVNNAAQQRIVQWNASLEAFKAANAAQAQALWSADHIQGWDAALRAVTGSQAYASMPFDRQIGLAYDLYAAEVKAVTGRALPAMAQATEPQPQPKPKPEPVGKRTDPRPDPVQTLGGLNGADDSLVTDGSFAAIDKMMSIDPIQAEQMLARLPEDKYDAYMRGR